MERKVLISYPDVLSLTQIVQEENKLFRVIVLFKNGEGYQEYNLLSKEEVEQTMNEYKAFLNKDVLNFAQTIK